MGIEIRQAHPLFAAIITGIDVAREPDAETVRIVEDAMAEYAVVAIRGSAPTDDQHIAFSRGFGPLELPPDMKINTAGYKRRIDARLYDAGNLDPDGEIVAADSTRRRYSKGNELFHTDSSFNSLPTKWSLLLAHIIPPEGGNTDFIDTRAVYDALSEQMKAKVEGLVAEHNLWHSREKGGLTTITDEMKKAMPAVQHPVVRRSANGRKALYIGAHASHIVGWPIEQGRALLEELFAFATQERFIYSHTWQGRRAGDLGQPLHPAPRRRVRRSQIQARHAADDDQRIWAGDLFDRVARSCRGLKRRGMNHIR